MFFVVIVVEGTRNHHIMTMAEVICVDDFI